jgi:hypothetical protein
MPFAVDPAAIRGSSASMTTYAGRRGPPDAALAETAAIYSAAGLAPQPAARAVRRWRRVG